jgi:hypothetical protein
MQLKCQKPELILDEAQMIPIKFYRGGWTPSLSLTEPRGFRAYDSSEVVIQVCPEGLLCIFYD